jgi:hypothetical protein
MDQLGGIHDAIDHVPHLPGLGNAIYPTFQTLDLSVGVVFVLFQFGLDLQLAHLLGGLAVVSLFALPPALNVEGQRMLEVLGVMPAMRPFTSTCSVEAVQADIEASRIVDAVEAEGAVFAVYSVVGLWRAEGDGGKVRTGRRRHGWLKRREKRGEGGREEEEDEDRRR